MKSYLQTKTGLLLLPIIVLFAATILGFTWRKWSSAKAQGNSNRPQAQVRVIDNPEWRESLPLREMARRSSLIVVGDASNGVSHLASDGQTVTTDYRITVREAIKGSLQPPRSVINVSLAGGVWGRSGGTLLEVRTTYHRKMQSGRTYVLFLTENPNRSGYWIPVRGPQGMYELSRTNSRVLHLGRSAKLPLDDPNAPDIATFLRELRQL